MLDVENVLTTRRLAKLTDNIQASAQESLLLLYRMVVEPQTAFDQAIEMIEKLPHHPFIERCIKCLDAGWTAFTRHQVHAGGEHLAQQSASRSNSCLAGSVEVFWEDLDPGSARRFDHADIVVQAQ